MRKVIDDLGRAIDIHKHKDQFKLKRFGFNFEIIVNKPYIIAKLIDFDTEILAVGKAKCNINLDQFNVKYGVRLAVHRVLQIYLNDKIQKCKHKLNISQGFLQNINAHFKKEFKKIGIVPKFDKSK